MPIFVTPLFAGLMTLLYIFLSVRVIGVRKSERIGLGDGGHGGLQRRMRAHGNFSEYVPLGLMLMLLLELTGAATWLLWALGAAFFIGRALHAYSVSQEPEPLKFRVAGMTLTFTVLVVAALTLLLQSAGQVLTG
ncbi:MAPEG family protein [Roseibium sp. LAB1]